MTFKAGDQKPPRSGRKAGTPNKISRDLKELIMDAMLDMPRGAHHT